MSHQEPSSPPSRHPHPPPPPTSRAWFALLAVPFVGLLYPPLYNRTDPEIAGIPFFYWFQLAMVPGGVACTAAVYLKTRGTR